MEKLAFYDEPISFADGNAVPEGTPDEILAAGKKMYQELSPETAEFIDFMFENELFDVLSAMARPLAATAPRSPIINPRSSSATLMLPPVMWMY